MTMEWVFDIKHIIFGAPAVGGITGHTYLIYGPLARGLRLLFMRHTSYPNAWQMVASTSREIYGGIEFYTSPTAISMLHSHAENEPKNYDLSSLKVRDRRVGQPIYPAWKRFL